MIAWGVRAGYWFEGVGVLQRCVTWIAQHVFYIFLMVIFHHYIRLGYRILKLHGLIESPPVSFRIWLFRVVLLFRWCCDSRRLEKPRQKQRPGVFTDCGGYFGPMFFPKEGPFKKKWQTQIHSFPRMVCKKKDLVTIFSNTGISSVLYYIWYHDTMYILA